MFMNPKQITDPLIIPEINHHLYDQAEIKPNIHFLNYHQKQIIRDLILQRLFADKIHQE